MCFDVSQLKKKMPTILRRLRHSSKSTSELSAQLDPLQMNDLYHASGFEHPLLKSLHLKEQSWQLSTYQWGLIPHWVQDQTKADQIKNKTLNARIETIFDKPSFRDAARDHRLLIPLDGFYEHHHKNGRKIPHYIYSSDHQLLFVAAIGSSWYHPKHTEHINTCSIVTCEANQSMSYIHNNPKLAAPRMPLIVRDEDIDQWMGGSKSEMAELVHKTKQIQLDYHTVESIKGRRYKGNNPSSQLPRFYPELMDPPTLF